MLEFYQAYSNYHDLMDLTEELIAYVALEVNGTTILPSGELDDNGTPIPRLDPDGNPIDLGKWERLTMIEAIIRKWPAGCGKPPAATEFSTIEGLYAMIDRANQAVSCELLSIAEDDYSDEAGHTREWARWSQSKWGGLRENIRISQSVGKAVYALFENNVEPFLIQPTIIYDYPTEVSPLSKAKPDDPDHVERFEFFIGGFEVGNAFSELNDPVEQHKRFEQQLGERAGGDDEAHQMDEDYVRALAYGLPPTAGEGIGIDRLTMVLTGSKSIRDVILFPLMRKRDEGTEGLRDSGTQ